MESRLSVLSYEIFCCVQICIALLTQARRDHASDMDDFLFVEVLGSPNNLGPFADEADGLVSVFPPIVVTSEPISRAPGSQACSLSYLTMILARQY